MKLKFKGRGLDSTPSSDNVTETVPGFARRIHTGVSSTNEVATNSIASSLPFQEFTGAPCCSSEGHQV